MIQYYRMPRCPNGTRKNKKTGECEPTDKMTKPETTEPISQSAKKSLRCPKGTRKNKKTGECESTNKITKPEPAKEEPKLESPLKEKMITPSVPSPIKEDKKEELKQKVQELKYGWEVDIKTLAGIELKNHTFQPNFGRLRDMGGNTRYYDMNLENSNLENVYFYRVSLYNANFNNAVMDRVHFTNNTLLDKCKFKNAELNRCTFDKVSIKETSFENATLWRCEFDFDEIHVSRYNSFKGAKLIDVVFKNISKEDAKMIKNELLKNVKSKKGVKFITHKK